MRAAAELKVVARGPVERERGGLIGKVQAIVLEHPGLYTRDIKKLLAGQARPSQVSGALNKLKNEGAIAQDWTFVRPKWVRPRGEQEAPRGRGDEVFCVNACGASILFGSLATEAERARPTCSLYPFARRGAA